MAAGLINAYCVHHKIWGAIGGLGLSGGLGGCAHRDGNGGTLLGEGATPLANEGQHCQDSDGLEVLSQPTVNSSYGFHYYFRSLGR